MRQKSLGSSQDAGKQLRKSHWARVIRGRDIYSYSTPAKHHGCLRRKRERDIEKIWSINAWNKTQQNMLEIIKQKYYVPKCFYSSYTIQLSDNCI